MFAFFGNQAYRSDRYCVLVYRDAGPWVGIRVKNGKQIFSFGRGSGKSEQALRRLADGAMQKLDEGESVDVVRAWARAQAALA